MEYLLVWKFLLEVPKFKKNFTHTFTSNNTCSIVSKMNEHRLFILINTTCSWPFIQTY